jgi:hypothetical protein
LIANSMRSQNLMRHSEANGSQPVQLELQTRVRPTEQRQMSAVQNQTPDERGGHLEQRRQSTTRKLLMSVEANLEQQSRIAAV